jgi:membrane dipeptidase
MRKGKVGLCLSTTIQRLHPGGSPARGWSSVAQAHAEAQAELAYYQILEFFGEMRLVEDRKGLAAHLAEWEAAGDDTDELPIGHVFSAEGGEFLTPETVGMWWEDGMRVASITYGESYLAPGGVGKDSYLTDAAEELLGTMDEVGMVLDLTHLYEGAFWQALDAFQGPVIATHQNCQALVSGVRQWSDEQILAVIERDGVIGAAFDAWMLHPGWVRRETRIEDTEVTMDTVVDHMDHVCQLAGNARHAAIGSDLDGGYGTEQSPKDLDTIADLQALPGLLEGRGYREEDTRLIMHGNWIRKLEEALPK